MIKENFPSDSELIGLLKEGSDNLEMLYKKHRNYCMFFMRKIHDDDALNLDIFHDALIVFYEKILTPNFVLKCSIQTYLNSICRNQILVRFKKNSKHSQFTEEFEDGITDWFEPIQDEDNERIEVIVKALDNLKNLGGKCYEILRRYYYEKKSLEKIAIELDYTNADNVKNQKSRCQKRLKEDVFMIMRK